MSKEIISKITSHYESCLRNNTDPLLQVDWTNREAAAVRYDVIVDFFYNLFPLYDGDPTVLDFGAGTGLLFRSLNGLCKYTGADSSEEMVAAAKQRLPKNEFFVCRDGALPENRTWDLVVANGVFTEKRDVHYSDMVDYVVVQLKILWKHTNKGLIFNFMNYHKIPVDKQYDTLFFVDYSLLVSILSEIGISRYIIDNSHKELNDYFVKCYKD